LYQDYLNKMAKKLKCWRRVSGERRGTAIKEWENKKTGETVFVHPIHTMKGKFFVMSSKRKRAIRNRVSKRVASSSIQLYMKKHDKCS